VRGKWIFLDSFSYFLDPSGGRGAEAPKANAFLKF